MYPIDGDDFSVSTDTDSSDEREEQIQNGGDPGVTVTLEEFPTLPRYNRAEQPVQQAQAPRMDPAVDTEQAPDITKSSVPKGIITQAQEPSIYPKGDSISDVQTPAKDADAYATASASLLEGSAGGAHFTGNVGSLMDLYDPIPTPANVMSQQKENKKEELLPTASIKFSHRDEEILRELQLQRFETYRELGIKLCPTRVKRESPVLASSPPMMSTPSKPLTTPPGRPATVPRFPAPRSSLHQANPHTSPTGARVIGSPRFARDTPSNRVPSMSPMQTPARYDERPYSPRGNGSFDRPDYSAALSPDDLEVEIQKLLKQANKRDQIPARQGWLYNSPCRFMPQCNQAQRCPFKHPTDLGKVMTRKDVLCRDGALCARTFCWFQHPGDSHTFVTRVSVLKERPAVRPKKRPPPVVPIDATAPSVTNGQAKSAESSPTGSSDDKHRSKRTNIAPEKPPGWLKSQIGPSDKFGDKKKGARRGRTRRGGRKNRRSAHSTTPGATTPSAEGGKTQGSKDATSKASEDKNTPEPDGASAPVTPARTKKRGRRGGRGGRKKKQSRKDKLDASPSKEGATATAAPVAPATETPKPVGKPAASTTEPTKPAAKSTNGATNGAAKEKSVNHNINFTVTATLK